MTMTTKTQANSGTTGSVAPAPASQVSTRFGPTDLVRLVYRQVLPGDVRKFEGTANTSPSGGGARDFRFSPYSKFQGIFERMLTGRKSEPRIRLQVTTLTTIYTSTVCVTDATGVTTTKTIEFEPPTDSRGDEGRLTRLNAYGLSVPTGAPSRVLLLLYQTGDGSLFLNFATEADLLNNVWEASVTRRLLGCLNERRPAAHAVQGFFDLATGDSYCKSNGA